MDSGSGTGTCRLAAGVEDPKNAELLARRFFCTPQPFFRGASGHIPHENPRACFVPRGAPPRCHPPDFPSHVLPPESRFMQPTRWLYDPDDCRH